MEGTKKNCKNDNLLLFSLNQRKRVNAADVELRWDNEENGK
jgi:hypothetical protein